MMRIDDHYLRPSANNLTITRLILAASVIYSHCFSLFVPGDYDDLMWLIGAPISNYAVDGFFALSGFLVYRSLAQNGAVGRFLMARLTRLWPGLAVMLLLTVIVGAFLSAASLRDYLLGRETLRFIAGNLSLLRAEYGLTELWCGGELCSVNGSLWTLPWEARCYVVLAGLALVSLANRTAMLRLVLPASLIFAVLWDVPAVASWVEAHLGQGVAHNLANWDRLWTAFAIGIAAYEFRHRIPLSWLILAGLVVLTILAHRFAPGAALHIRELCIAYAALCIGFLTARTRAISASWPDYSYGMYIYAFPVMMVAQGLFGFTSPYTLGLANLLLTIPFAAASWHFVEKPALDWLRRRQRTAYAARVEPDDVTLKPAEGAGTQG